MVLGFGSAAASSNSTTTTSSSSSSSPSSSQQSPLDHHVITQTPGILSQHTTTPEIQHNMRSESEDGEQLEGRPPYLHVRRHLYSNFSFLAAGFSLGF